MDDTGIEIVYRTHPLTVGEYMLLNDYMTEQNFRALIRFVEARTNLIAEQIFALPVTKLEEIANEITQSVEQKDSTGLLDRLSHAFDEPLDPNKPRLTRD